MEKEIRRVFISVPMRDRSEEDIKNDIDNAIIDLKEYFDRYDDLEFIFVDNMIEQPEGCEERLYCLGEAIKKLGTCDWIVMCKNWEAYSGCIVEHMTALQYKIKIFRYDNHGHFGCYHDGGM